MNEQINELLKSEYERLVNEYTDDKVSVPRKVYVELIKKYVSWENIGFMQHHINPAREDYEERLSEVVAAILNRIVTMEIKEDVRDSLVNTLHL